MMVLFKNPNRVYHFFTKHVVIFLCVMLIMFTSQVYAENIQKKLTLENKSFEGSVKAKGIIGLFSINGSLSFDEEFLIWTTANAENIGTYEIQKLQAGIKFSATLSIENNEKIEWSGMYDGVSLYDVEAVWTRNQGDFFHDLLLPDVVTLVFTPKHN